MTFSTDRPIEFKYAGFNTNTSLSYPVEKRVTIAPSPFNDQESITCTVDQIFSVGLQLNIKSFRDKLLNIPGNTYKDGILIVEVTSIKERGGILKNTNSNKS